MQYYIFICLISIRSSIMDKAPFDFTLDLFEIAHATDEVDELTKFIGLDNVTVYSMILPGSKMPVCSANNQMGNKVYVFIAPWLYRMYNVSKKWKRRIEAVLLHEKCHIIHDDFKQIKWDDKGAGVEKHRRWMPVLSEARADRYVCKCGMGRDLLSFMRVFYWCGDFLFKTDEGARIELIKRYLKENK